MSLRRFSLAFMIPNTIFVCWTSANINGWQKFLVFVLTKNSDSFCFHLFMATFQSGRVTIIGFVSSFFLFFVSHFCFFKSFSARKKWAAKGNSKDEKKRKKKRDQDNKWSGGLNYPLDHKTRIDRTKLKRKKERKKERDLKKERKIWNLFFLFRLKTTKSDSNNRGKNCRAKNSFLFFRHSFWIK